jgi:hypothetical protein
VFKWGGCRSLTGLALDDLDPEPTRTLQLDFGGKKAELPKRSRSVGYGPSREQTVPREVEPVDIDF